MSPCRKDKHGRVRVPEHPHSEQPAWVQQKTSLKQPGKYSTVQFFSILQHMHLIQDIFANMSKQ